jgi:hypothetical protein
MQWMLPYLITKRLWHRDSAVVNQEEATLHKLDPLLDVTRWKEIGKRLERNSPSA